jgi:hypothetical protein
MEINQVKNRERGDFDLPTFIATVVTFVIIGFLVSITIRAIVTLAKNSNTTRVEYKGRAEYTKGIHKLSLPIGQKLVSVDCSLGELHVLTRNAKLGETLEIYSYTGYEGWHNELTNKTGLFIITEH